MKTFIIIVALFWTSKLMAQCEVKANYRDDGTTVRYTRPGRIGYSDKVLLAMSMQTNGVEYFVATLCIFEHHSQKLKGNLILQFNNDKSSTLDHVSSLLTTFNGNPACVSIFKANPNDIKNLSGSLMKIIAIQLEDGVHQTILPKANKNLLINHYRCLSR